MDLEVRLALLKKVHHERKLRMRRPPRPMDVGRSYGPWPRHRGDIQSIAMARATRGFRRDILTGKLPAKIEMSSEKLMEG